MNDWYTWTFFFFGNGNLDWGLVQCMNGSSSHTYMWNTFIYKEIWIDNSCLANRLVMIDSSNEKSTNVKVKYLTKKKKEDVDNYRKLIFFKKKINFLNQIKFENLFFILHMKINWEQKKKKINRSWSRDREMQFDWWWV